MTIEEKKQGIRDLIEYGKKKEKLNYKMLQYIILMILLILQI